MACRFMVMIDLLSALICLQPEAAQENLHQIILLYLREYYVSPESVDCQNNSAMI